MANCPKCGEAFNSLVPGELCPDCRPPQPLVIGSGLDDGDSIEPEAGCGPITVPPLGVAILSILNYAFAVIYLVYSVAYVAGPSAVATLIGAFGGQGGSEPNSSTLSIRLAIAGLYLLASLVSYLLGRGLWMLRGWARSLVLILGAIELIFGAPQNGIASRIVSLTIIVYLLTPRVKAIFCMAATSRQPAL